MSHTGHIQYYSWLNGSEPWVLEWQEPKDACSKNNVCGLSGLCTPYKKDPESFMCSCLDGFKPASPDEYNAHDYKSGCKRTSETICHTGTNDTFIKKTMISMDDTSLPFNKTKNEAECIKMCLENCTCRAYSYSSSNKGGIQDVSRNATQGGCWFWDSEPNNLRENGLHNISFRVSKGSSNNSSSGKLQPKFEKRDLAIVIVITGLVISIFCGISYILYLRMVNRSENNQQNIETQPNDMWRRITELLDVEHSREDDREGIDVPYFDLESIINATDGFSEKNRLGQGGFGPVYKGKLPGGKEIAVKRLSSLSGQDEDMNPKISDFGLAKIVKGKDMEATTDRVIGTFGYMSPEYALDGLFSVKSDVFSFGVVMLEIVSGKRNIGFYQSRKSISLLAHAWNLWKEDKPFELMDEILTESCNSTEVLKCIIVGLLCVQGDPDDRPNMTNVILMLGGDIVTLPTPKEPGSIPGTDYAISSSSSSSKLDTQSKNMLTITKLDGR
ncbi:hypothetical protein L1887_13983 [Cichorium endivia]|nr:hypothetical protein L1887_13983 [Cichorium endivia]